MEPKFRLPYFSVPGAVKYLGVSAEAVLMSVRKGDLPALVQVEDRKMFDRTEIEAWARRRNV